MENGLVSTISIPKLTLYTVRLFYIYPDRCFVNYGFKCVIAECFAYNDCHVAAMRFEVREREWNRESTATGIAHAHSTFLFIFDYAERWVLLHQIHNCFFFQ